MPRTLLLLAATLLLTACNKSAPTAQAAAAPAPSMKPAPPTPIEEKKEQLGGNTWDPQWDALVEQSLPPEMLSAQAGHAVISYCPAFNQIADADKRAFWAYFFQALAGAEAGLNPDTDVHHSQPTLAKTDTVSHRPIRQEGLLQLTYEDAQRYNCPFDFAHDRTLAEKDPDRTILQPANNLACGIRIMQNQIIDQHKPLIAHSSYWSTLQPGTASYRVFAKQMANVPAACGLHTHASHTTHTGQ